VKLEKMDEERMKKRFRLQNFIHKYEVIVSFVMRKLNDSILWVNKLDKEMWDECHGLDRDASEWLHLRRLGLNSDLLERFSANELREHAEIIDEWADYVENVNW